MRTKQTVNSFFKKIILIFYRSINVRQMRRKLKIFLMLFKKILREQKLYFGFYNV